MSYCPLLTGARKSKLDRAVGLGLLLHVDLHKSFFPRAADCLVDHFTCYGIHNSREL